MFLKAALDQGVGAVCVKVNHFLKKLFDMVLSGNVAVDVTLFETSGQPLVPVLFSFRKCLSIIRHLGGLMLLVCLEAIKWRCFQDACACFFYTYVCLYKYSQICVTRTQMCVQSDVLVRHVL